MEEIDRRQKLLEETDETKNSMMFDSGNLSSADPRSLGNIIQKKKQKNLNKCIKKSIPQIQEKCII